MIDGKYVRHYTLRCSYEGHKEFYFGTLTIDGRNAKEHKILEMFKEKWKIISPHPFPDRYVIVPGMVVFVPAKDEQ